MRKLFIISIHVTFFLLLGSVNYAQNSKTDSLLKQLNITQNDKSKVTLLLEITKSLYAEFPDSSNAYCLQANQICHTNNFKLELAYCLHAEARYILLKGDVKKAIENINKALAIFETTNELKGIAKCYSLKSVAVGRLNQNKEQLSYLLKAKSIYLKLNEPQLLQGIYTNLSNAYRDLKLYDSALIVLKEFDKLPNVYDDNRFYSEISYGSIYFELNDMTKALTHFNNCVSVAAKYKMLDSEITGLTKIAECYLSQNNLTQATSYYKQALQLAKQNNLMVEEADALKGIVKLYEKQHNYIDGFSALQQLKLIEDSLLNIEKIKSINEIENRLALTEKEKIIAEQNLSIEKSKVETANYKTNLLIALGILGLAIIGFASLFYYSRKINKLLSLIKTQKVEVEKQKEIIEIKNKDVMDSIHYAKNIQGSMLPSQRNVNALFKDNFIYYQPKDVVAGDFYFIEKINNLLCIAICDCTGHGVPGAMVSIVANNALHRAINEFKLSSPEKIFDKVNELMQETFSKSDYQIQDGMDASICMIDYENNELLFATANNPIWILEPTNTNIDYETTVIVPDKQPIGKHSGDNKLFNLKRHPLRQGQTIYMFTDGYADQFGGPKAKKFKYKPLQELLQSIAHLPCVEQKQKLHTVFTNWKGNLEQVDDVLIAAIKV